MRTPDKGESRSMTGPGRQRMAVATAAALGLLLAVGLAVRPAVARGLQSDGSLASLRERHKTPGKVPSERMRELDFMLGTWKCEFDGNPTVGDSTVYTRTRPTLGGHFYQIEIRQVKPGVPDVNGRWVIGWSEAESRFVSYYYDDNVMHGSSFSPGWQNGDLVFTGTYFLASKGLIEVRDEFVVHDRNHFEIFEYVKVDGEWKLFDRQDCRRR